jgi:glycosyltransferase involved in cell wall biosynthesis
VVVHLQILQITKYFYPAVSFGGPIQCTYNLSKYLVSKGHKVTVYATDALDISSNARIKDEYRCIDGIDVYYFRNVSKLYGFFFSPGLIQKLNQEIDKFDVAHLHEYRTFQNVIFSLKNKTVPYVLTCHGEFSYSKQSLDQLTLRRLFEEIAGKRIVSNAARLVALTPFERNQFLEGDVEKDKIVIIPNGVSSIEFECSSPNLFKKVYGIKEANFILYVGRINRYKGLDFLVQAFALICRERADVKLVLAGPDDGFLGTLRQLVAELGITNKVLFTGSLDRKKVAAAYADCLFVVYVSVQEGFPMVPLEAASAGKPVIVTDLPAMDYVRRGKFGSIVHFGNILQLKNAIQKFVENPDLAKMLGKNGKKFVEKNYSWQVVGNEIEEVYQSVLN